MSNVFIQKGNAPIVDNGTKLHFLPPISTSIMHFWGTVCACMVETRKTFSFLIYKAI